MPAKKADVNECCKHKGKALIMVGLLMVLYGAMRYYGIGIPMSLMTIGGLLVLKGLIVKLKNKK